MPGSLDEDRQKVGEGGGPKRWDHLSSRNLCSAFKAPNTASNMHLMNADHGHGLEASISSSAARSQINLPGLTTAMHTPRLVAVYYS